MPGGAGDEEPARTLALFTGEGGRITPRVVRVPPFIAMRVELRSADGAQLLAALRRQTITAGGELSSASTTFDGLRPGGALVGAAAGARATRSASRRRRSRGRSPAASLTWLASQASEVNCAP